MANRVQAVGLREAAGTLEGLLGAATPAELRAAFGLAVRHLTRDDAARGEALGRQLLLQGIQETAIADSARASSALERANGLAQHEWMARLAAATARMRAADELLFGKRAETAAAAVAEVAP